MPVFSSISVVKSVVLLLLVVPATLAAPFDNLHSSSKRQAAAGVSTQQDAPWHLVRLTSTESLNKGTELVDPGKGVYKYPTSAGEGVDIYVVDTGVAIQPNIKEFGARATFLPATPGDDGGPEPGQMGFHGTMVAGLAASSSWGVAKKANIISIRSSEQDFVKKILDRHNERKKLPAFKGSVLNYSRGRSFDQPIAEGESQVYKPLIDAGVHVVMSAGNKQSDACKHYPSGINQFLKEVIAVGATDWRDWIWKNKNTQPGQLSSGSNFGACVDIWAPGFRNPSTNTKGQDHGLGSMTSAATPVVAGMIAVELSVHPELKLNPKAMKAHILAMGFQNIVHDSEGKLLAKSVLVGNKDLAMKPAASNSGSPSNGSSPNKAPNGAPDSELKVNTPSNKVPQGPPSAGNTPSNGNKSSSAAAGGLPKIRFIEGSYRCEVTLPGKAEQGYPLQAIRDQYRGKQFQTMSKGALVTFTICGADMPPEAKSAFDDVC
ncbi:serine protease [Orbilia ellipsospora]|uniref:Serine protease n=1 Tax=Orbilia ellipsospora TaxID=2528407 RepID=A0AAV9WXC3_9PEZI